MELQLKETKLHNTEQELEEVSRSGGSSEQVNGLRKAKNDLQLKVKELVWLLHLLYNFIMYICIIHIQNALYYF